MSETKEKTNIFKKLVDAGDAFLEAQIAKARFSIEDLSKAQSTDTADFNFGKAITRDRSHYTSSQGFQEKAGSLTYDFQKQMAVKSSIISAIIKTRQNQVASFSQYQSGGGGVGFKIKLKHEQDELEKIKIELFGEDPLIPSKAGPNSSTTPQSPMGGDIASKNGEEQQNDSMKDIQKADDIEALTGLDDHMNKASLSATEKDRIAKKELDKRTKKKKRAIADFLLHCGNLDDRPFESKKWTFDTFLRAIVWDSLVYDFLAVELVPKEAEMLDNKINIHHFQPIDGSTIRFASEALKRYKQFDAQMTGDILYPEEELKALEEKDALELDEDRLEKNLYKYVQVIKGRIQRAFTEYEMRVGMRNPVTDIYQQGYSISELELLVSLVTSHLQTEFYNRAYFQQGFSAKGILHVKANLNRSKLEELRRNWNHMVKGNRNSFQTPIMAGMDEVQWIPLTQSHSEMEFNLWLNYLIKMICAIYQIDPAEIGYGMKDEGGAGMSGDNTSEKLTQSKDKGFKPLMKFLQDWINSNIIDNIDAKYMMEWVGIEQEGETAKITRQAQEVKCKKTLNEVRSEDGLPPIDGADILLEPTFLTWYTQFSDAGKQAQQEMQQQQAQQMAGQPQDPSHQDQWNADQASADNDHQRQMEQKMLDHELSQQAEKNKPKDMKKSLKIEYYRL